MNRHPPRPLAGGSIKHLRNPPSVSAVVRPDNPAWSLEQPAELAPYPSEQRGWCSHSPRLGALSRPIRSPQVASTNGGFRQFGLIRRIENVHEITQLLLKTTKQGLILHMDDGSRWMLANPGNLTVTIIWTPTVRIKIHEAEDRPGIYELENTDTGEIVLAHRA